MSESKPIQGKTYSLYGKGSSTLEFYADISRLTDELLSTFDSPERVLLDLVRKASRKRIKLRRSIRRQPEQSELAYILKRAKGVMSDYLGEVEKHNKSVSLRRHLSDPDLLTPREHYYLYMIEYELVNRLHLETFKKASFKIALLPYCLKESHTNCKAMQDEIDYQCNGCLKTCYINRIGAILRKQDINPYILSRGRVSSLLKGLFEKHGSIGVMGIACLVELVMGMRLCMKSGLPVIGIPLNANRCPRWMGSMHDTSIDLAAIENLIMD